MRLIGTGNTMAGKNIGNGSYHILTLVVAGEVIQLGDGIEEKSVDVRFAVRMTGLGAGSRTLSFKTTITKDAVVSTIYPILTKLVPEPDTSNNPVLIILDVPIADITTGYLVKLYVSSDNNADSSVATTVQCFTHDQTDVAEDTRAAFLGSGLQECILIIRKTNSTGITQAKVWLSTTNDQSDPILPPQFTGDDFTTTWYLDIGTTYYVHCKKAGYSFTVGSFVPADMGAEADTESLLLGTEIVELTTTVEDEAFISRTLRTARRHVDEPELNAKYTDVELTRMIGEAYVAVISEVNRNRSTPVVGKIVVTTDGTASSYQLPYHATVIVAVYTEDEASGIRWFWACRGPFNQKGRGVWVEGNVLKVIPRNVGSGTKFTVEFIPGGAASLNMGILTSISSDKTAVVLPAAPTLGTLDGHENAYAGCMIRVGLGSNNVEERVITSYDRATMTATLDIPITQSGAMPYYEIAPQIYSGLDHVIGLYLAYWIAGIEGHPVRNARLEKMMNNAMRNLRLDGFYSKLDTATDMGTDGPTYGRYRRFNRGPSL
jgi:hypothetical protein